MENRKVIQAGIENGSTKADIARTIGKDATTVAKEIRNHRKLKPRNTFNRPVLCAKRKGCKRGFCVQKCEQYEEPKCSRRDISPGACNKCPNGFGNKCPMDKYIYDAEVAEQQYRSVLSDSREGINLTAEERASIGEVIAPLLSQGQSVYQILSTHKGITQSERTMYSYIECGVFKDFGVNNFSLKEQVNRKQFKQKYKKRKEPANYMGRKYSDYLSFRADNPDTLTVGMDVVYNHPQGPYLQTFLFENTAFMIGFLHEVKDNEHMAKSINILQSRIGAELFSRLFSLILTDRGTEFEMAHLFELNSDASTRLNIFYCDPMQSSQKPHVENNHNYIRDIIPNGYPLNNITQDQIDLMFSHINSTPRRSLGGRTPYEIFCFMYGTHAAQLLNILEIKRDDVVLKPSLLYAIKR